MNEAFDIFFEEKRIDLKAFRENRKDLCEELEKLFNQIGPRSFDQQKKFLFNPLRLDFPLKTPLPEKSKPIKTKPALRKKTIKAPRSVQQGTNEEAPQEKSNPAPPLKRPVMKPKATAKPKPPPLKRPLMKKKDSAEGKTGEESKAKPPLKRPIMKPKGDAKPKPPPLKRPLMKKKEANEEKPSQEPKKAPPLKRPLKRPIMKPRDKKD